jgi:hypothetical protein
MAATGSGNSERALVTAFVETLAGLAGRLDQELSDRTLAWLAIENTRPEAERDSG